MMSNQNPTAYSPRLVGAAAAAIVLTSLVFLISRALLPGDNSQILFEGAIEEETGLAVETLNPDQPLQNNDVVISVNNRSLADWLTSHLDRTTTMPSLENGQSLDYIISREGIGMTVPIQLQPFDLGQALIERWSLYFFLFYLLLVSMVVFLKKPHAQSAQVFLLLSSAIFASGLIFFLGLQISDLFRPLQIALWFWGSIVLYGLLTAGLLHFTLIFPYPSINPKYRTRILTAIYLGVWLPYLVLVFVNLSDVQGSVELLLLLARSTAIMTLIFFPLVLIASVLKYRNTKSATARRQMRWILWAAVIANVPWLILSTVPAVMGGASQIASLVTGLLWILIPTAFAISILREGLFDIDIIIHRTLVYGLLTALLIGIYFGMVILMQAIFTAVSGQQSAVAIVISTLVIAALFQPLRQRIQRWIDRQFFRRKFDASQTLAAFASKARDEVDLEKLSNELLEVVKETMQPEQAWLWFRPGIVAEQTSAFVIKNRRIQKSGTDQS